MDPERGAQAVERGVGLRPASRERSCHSRQRMAERCPFNRIPYPPFVRPGRGPRGGSTATGLPLTAARELRSKGEVAFFVSR